MTAILVALSLWPLALIVLVGASLLIGLLMGVFSAVSFDDRPWDEFLEGLSQGSLGGAIIVTSLYLALLVVAGIISIFQAIGVNPLG